MDRSAVWLLFLLPLAGCLISRPAPETTYPRCGTRYDELLTRVGEVEVGPAGTDSTFAFDWAAVADSIQYPEFARRAGIEGKVLATILVSPTGKAVAVRVTASPHALLYEAAQRGLDAATFAPAPDHQQVINAEVTFRLRFR